MHYESRRLWARYCEHRVVCRELAFSLDVSRVRFPDGWLARMDDAAGHAIEAMHALERGAIANADERRMVGHYWLRAPELAPGAAMGAAIRDAVTRARAFAEAVRSGAIAGAGGSFAHVLHVGIGGSALGAQLLCDALDGDTVEVGFLDNADPDGIDRALARRGGGLGRTLVSVVSKCGRTPTPMLVLRELEARYAHAGLDFSRHAIATTMESSTLDARARAERWLARLPMWDWVGGRTSVTSAVGLLPAALRGIDVIALLEGAAAMDRLTRRRQVRANPAAMLALMWHWLGGGRGEKNMVILPYRDRLATFPRWTQQLVMESLGKRLDRRGAVVHQGLTVHGHKGATDQHAYVQQLRDGRADSFVVFVRTQEERAGALETDEGITLGDHLFGNFEATRRALWDRGRDSITITLADASPRSLGALIALFERAVGIYAELIDVNAYHQPGVDKDAAAPVVALQREVIAHLAASSVPMTADEIASALDRADDVETVFAILERLASDPRRGVALVSGGHAREARFAAA